MLGTVESFDFDAGLGVVADLVGRSFVFHCASIADGTRNIAVASPVEFDELLKLGRVEAGNIRSL